ncbi:MULTISPECIES: class I SAM-dependent methyltransferase [unclassified Bradyrhizobium]|uniref:class I SAM-dependent methyltransferase n=2 Tax=Bradyrhizobium TaxID=374 RepID=UPI0028E7A4A9|nr:MULTISPECIES: class I SAM-dependent methyltransferase [unclassified Bradyrhizobium]
MPSPAIKVENVSKAYTVWSSPAARLHGPLLGRLGQLPFLPAAARDTCERLSHGAVRNYYALHDVSLEVRRGASVGIIGRNGSGKSTLLQLLAGTLTPSQGEIAVVGSIAAMLELGSGFDPDFSGRENVYLNAAIRGMSRRQTDAKFDEIAAFADIGDFIDQPTKTYSSGMIVRLAFATSACLKPEVLLVDEALSVGDIFFQQKCIRHMREAMADVTKVFVTHDLQAIRSVTEYAYVLDRGEIVFAGNSRDAVDFYVRMSHRVSDGRDRSVADAGSAALGRRSAPGADMDADRFKRLPWIDLKSSQLSGAGDVLIRRVAVTKPDLAPAGTVQAGDRISVDLLLGCAATTTHVIVGYLLSDRLGNQICGENSCSLARGLVALDPGEHLVRLEFVWPEIQPGDYTLTVGIGEGTDPLRHVVQCWAHSVVKLNAISPGRAIHGIFNNPITKLDIAPLGGSAARPAPGSAAPPSIRWRMAEPARSADLSQQPAWVVSEPAYESDVLNPQLAISPWQGHRDFAYDLVGFARPRLIVELGVHYGCSYFAFCQAVKDRDLPSRVVGIDTWEGDEHCGHYGGEAYETVAKTMAASFADDRFVLHRARFDQATEAFDDDSIDLLHIDGLHTYDAVRSDFTTWLPKLARDGIILMHDIASSSGYESARFWAEIKQRHPHFEFLNRWGLGILFPKGERWYRAGLAEGVPDKIRGYLYRGEWLVDRYRASIDLQWQRGQTDRWWQESERFKQRVGELERRQPSGWLRAFGIVRRSDGD